MIKPGLVSITFRELPAKEIIDLVVRAGLSGVEWGGDIHVKHGDIKAARLVRKMSDDAGIGVLSYGSYYEVAANRCQPFENILETAIELGAPNIRIWAGNRGSDQSDPDHWNRIIEQTRVIGDKAEAEGLTVAFEFHSRSLTDTARSARKLLDDIDHDNVFVYWQPITGASIEDNLADIEMLKDRVTNIHVFHWWPDTVSRFELSEGQANWRRYLQKLDSSERDRFALLEFVKDEDPEIFLKDAETLKKLLGELSSSD